MSIDREKTLRNAERLLRQGRLDGAIAEYVRLIEDSPADWNTMNTLGDLYARAGRIEQAVVQYTKVAEHFSREGFFPKAVALYKKILKINPEADNTVLTYREKRVRGNFVNVDPKAFEKVAQSADAMMK